MRCVSLQSFCRVAGRPEIPTISEVGVYYLSMSKRLLSSRQGFLGWGEHYQSSSKGISTSISRLSFSITYSSFGAMFSAAYSSMANFFSGTASSEPGSDPPKGVEPIIKDSLYKLYEPDGELLVDIIFFHGLQPVSYADAYWRTWTTGKNQLWPRTLLAEDFPQARVLSVSYDSCAAKSASGGLLDMFQIGENLVTIILGDNKLHVGQNRPVILVGHSLGGLVIKQFLLTADKLRTYQNRPELDKFLDTYLTGVFYYATPHGGSILADKAAKILPKMSPLVGFLHTLNKDAARLNNEFRTWRKGCKLPTYAIAELHKTSFWGLNAVVVEEASSRIDVDTGNYYSAGKDHINICKPEDKTDITYQRLQVFIETSVKQKVGLDLVAEKEKLDNLT